ncbi:Uncharacterized protein YR821_2977 [Yersinia ruckeri]|uniref:Uncharacterized protein n=1 Tax=Yersinia ruckeri TaxID=29486 RepID=A0A0A8VMJ6_YERRU|nr:Uncharacterized protein YR821_2977 [Yersinia ruckeri]CEK28816.1 hypothetical protein CSF007_15465 [Yersinia ruckeri]
MKKIVKKFEWLDRYDLSRKSARLHNKKTGLPSIKRKIKPGEFSQFNLTASVMPPLID